MGQLDDAFEPPATMSRPMNERPALGPPCGDCCALRTNRDGRIAFGATRPIKPSLGDNSRRHVCDYSRLKVKTASCAPSSHLLRSIIALHS